MNRTTQRPKAAWRVKLAPELCSLCEVCVHRCPTGALRLDKTDREVSLVFSSGRCHGCPGQDTCQSLCPEEAISLVATPAADCPDGDTRLLSSELLVCSYCQARFAPLRKLDALTQRNPERRPLVRDLCPLCRRTQLVVSFIKEHRDPNGHAEYRSFRDSLRKSGR